MKKIITIMLIVPFLAMPIMAQAQTSNIDKDAQDFSSVDLTELIPDVNGIYKIPQDNVNKERPYNHNVVVPNRNSYIARRYESDSTF